jgi:hypothetical protein
MMTLLDATLWRGISVLVLTAFLAAFLALTDAATGGIS